MTGPHERWDELVAGYALDALEPAEEAELLTHLENCAMCQGTLRDHQLVAAQLAALAQDDELAPPAWAAIRAGIVGTESTPSAPAVISIEERRAARTRRPLVLGAAAAAVVVVAGVVTAVAVNTGGQSARDAAISACRTQAACHIVELSSGGHRRAVVIVRNGSARLWPTDLSSATDSHVYALWQLPRAGRPTLLAQPVPRASASSAPLALPYDETAAFAISVEPSGAPAVAPTHVVAVGTATT
jgi:anti-sigma-K factor RskA